ncbi:phosphotransferase [Amycolatopsis sp. NBC_01480]|uniref:phosphotransferase n=1 Tax=Amycolatopsis sp. NBC_01480 TaxID=2903562 RepID=UPI002E2AD0CF|nr:phosphotransferase [Amycolatopsis sp. NBC_01480]
MTGPEEIPLAGGNMNTGVVRVGDTVRRPAGPWTPAVHALLKHLRSTGFRGAPRPLGLDDQGREVLTYAEGPVVHPDHPETMEPDAALTRVARLIRDFHDAVAGFEPPPDARWQVVIPGDGAEIIAHHDLAPWNLVAGAEWVFIDWDTAAPGTRLWDLAYAAPAFAPLRPGTPRAEAKRRLRLFADAYGLDQQQRKKLAQLMGPRSRSMYTHLKTQAEQGNQPWARLWHECHGRVWLAAADYLDAHAEDWRAALLA